MTISYVKWIPLNVRTIVLEYLWWQVFYLHLTCWSLDAQSTLTCLDMLGVNIILSMWFIEAYLSIETMILYEYYQILSFSCKDVVELILIDDCLSFSTSQWAQGWKKSDGKLFILRLKELGDFLGLKYTS